MRTYLKRLLILVLIFSFWAVVAMSESRKITVFDIHANYKKRAEEVAEKVNTKYKEAARRAATQTLREPNWWIKRAIKQYYEAIVELEAVSDNMYISDYVRYIVNVEITRLRTLIQETVEDKSLMWSDFCVVCGKIKE